MNYNVSALYRPAPRISSELDSSWWALPARTPAQVQVVKFPQVLAMRDIYNLQNEVFYHI